MKIHFSNFLEQTFYELTVKSDQQSDSWFLGNVDQPGQPLTNGFTIQEKNNDHVKTVVVANKDLRVVSRLIYDINDVVNLPQVQNIETLEGSRGNGFAYACYLYLIKTNGGVCSDTTLKKGSLAIWKKLYGQFTQAFYVLTDEGKLIKLPKFVIPGGAAVYVIDTRNTGSN